MLKLNLNSESSQMQEVKSWHKKKLLNQWKESLKNAQYQPTKEDTCKIIPSNNFERVQSPLQNTSAACPYQEKPPWKWKNERNTRDTLAGIYRKSTNAKNPFFGKSSLKAKVVAHLCTVWNSLWKANAKLTKTFNNIFL